jgi:hypothetical protein
MSFWQAYKYVAAVALAICLWVYFLFAVNQLIADHLMGYLQGLAFAVWNPLWIALAIAYGKGRTGNEDDYDRDVTDEEQHYREYDH